MDPIITTESSLFYLLLASISLILAIVAEKTKKKYWVAILVLVWSFVAGFRAYSVGRDTQNYITLFHQISNHTATNIEVGFEWFSRLILSITRSESATLFVYALIIYGCIIFRFWDLRQYSSFPCAVIIFFSIYYFETLNILRQYVAMALIFYATRYIAERKYVRFSIFVLLAVSFHTSAILGFGYLAIELFFWKTLNKKQKWFLTLVSVLGFALLPVVFSATEKYSQYFRWTTIDVGLRVFALFAIWFVSLFFFKTKKSKDLVYHSQSKAYLIRTTQWYYLIGCLLGLIGYFYELMGRISVYYALFFSVYLGIIAKEKRQGVFKTILLCMILFVTLYILYGYLFTINGSWHHPYKFVWD